jgi:conserved oligomeric Golgi complex subunit 2
LNNNEKKQKSDDFDFIINSIWSEVVTQLDFSLNKIFSPSDPDLFHTRYISMLSFIKEFQIKCSVYVDDTDELKRRLIRSPSYRYLMKKWPLNVYFEIRFQEIVTQLENQLINYQKLNSYNKEEVLENDTRTFNLATTDTLIKQIEYLWSENECFLSDLLPQIWKLFLQLISRFTQFFINNFRNKLSKPEVPIVDNSRDTFTDKNEMAFNVLLVNDVHKLWSLRVFILTILMEKQKLDLFLVLILYSYQTSLMVLYLQ